MRPAPKLPLDAFRELHLLSAWKALDKPSGIVYMHEVRRDRSTGLTLKAKWPVRNQHRRPHHV